MSHRALLLLWIALLALFADAPRTALASGRVPAFRVHSSSGPSAARSLPSSRFNETPGNHIAPAVASWGQRAQLRGPLAARKTSRSSTARPHAALTCGGAPRLDPETGVPFAQKGGSQDKSHSDAWSYYFTDLKGLPEKIVDGSGQVLTTYEHSAFGKATATGTTLTPFRAPGQQEDPETGLFYNRYRYYDPDLGRFISPDPIGLDGGLNTYSYGPNPIDWIDPMGWHGVKMTSTTGHSKTYKSGWQTKKNPDAAKGSYPALEPQPKAHTEQKFVSDLLSGEHGEGFSKTDKFTLEGEFPPCPRCHAAMMRGAQQSGATIDYKWKNKNGEVETISYEGGTGKPTADAKATWKKEDGTEHPRNQAQELVDAYPDETRLTGTKEGYQFDKDPNAGANDYWGVNPKEGADDTYLAMVSDSNRGQAKRDEKGWGTGPQIQPHDD